MKKAIGILSRPLSVLFLLMFTIVCFCVSSKMRHGYECAPLLGIAMLAAAVWIYHRIKHTKIRKKLDERKLLIVFIIAQLFMLILQILIISSLRFRGCRDVLYVDEAAKLFAQTGKYDGIDHLCQKNYYFARYPNNWGIVLLLSSVYRVLYLALGRIPGHTSEVLAVFCIQLSGLFIFMISRRIFRDKVQVLYCTIIYALHPACYVNAPIFYTDVLTMPFVTSAAYVFIKYLDSKKTISKYLYLLLSAFLVGIGYGFKGSLGVLAVAFIVFTLFKAGIRRFLCTAAAMLFALSAVTSAIRTIGIKMDIASAEELERYELPLLHWVNMSMHGAGRFSPRDTNRLLKYETYEKRKEMALYSIKHRTMEYGAKKLLRTATRKIAFNWSGGTFQQKYLDNSENASLRYFLTRGRKLNMYAYSLHMMILFLILFSYIRGINTSDVNNIWLLRLTLFGFALFFIFWEVKPRYLLNILSLMIVLSADGLRYLDAIVTLLLNRYSYHKTALSADNTAA